jgi:hypothetical protein
VHYDIISRKLESELSMAKTVRFEELDLMFVREPDRRGQERSGWLPSQAMFQATNK